MAPESIVLSAMIAVLTSTVSSPPRTADVFSFVSWTTPRAVCAQPVTPTSASTHAIDHKAFMMPPRVQRKARRSSGAAHGGGSKMCACATPRTGADSGAGAANMGNAAPMPKVILPEDIEELRDQSWRREATRQIENALEAERFIERVGFAA